MVATEVAFGIEFGGWMGAMPRLEWLNWLNRSQQIAAIEAVLPHAEQGERDRIVEQILDKDDANSQSRLAPVLLRQWEHLSKQSRISLIACLARDLAAILHQMGSSDLSREPEIAQEIAAWIVIHQSDAGFRLVDDKNLIIEIDDLIARGLKDYLTTRSGLVLQAALEMSHIAGPKLRALLNDATQPCHLPLRSVARASSAGMASEKLILWLGIPAIAPVARERLSKASQQPADFQALLRGAHLLGSHGRWQACRHVLQSGSMSMAIEAGDMKLEARRGLGRLLRHSGERVLVRAALERAARDDDALAVLRIILGTGVHPAFPGLDDRLLALAQSPNEIIAHAAASMLASAESAARRRASLQALQQLSHSPHAAVRCLARETVCRWDAWASIDDETDDKRPSIAARIQALENPEAFARELREQLARAKGQKRLNLLELALRCGVLHAIEKELIELSSGDDVQAASKAALLLGRFRSAVAQRAVAAALDHPESRIRASAIEGLPLRIQIEHSHVNRWMRDEAPRVRANATRRLLRVNPDSAEAFRQIELMLHDPRPGHRRSGLWLAVRTRNQRFIPILTSICMQDPDSEVAAQAERCLNSLHAISSGSGATV